MSRDQHSSHSSHFQPEYGAPTHSAIPQNRHHEIDVRELLKGEINTPTGNDPTYRIFGRPGQNSSDAAYQMDHMRGRTIVPAHILAQAEGHTVSPIVQRAFVPYVAGPTNPTHLARAHSGSSYSASMDHNGVNERVDHNPGEKFIQKSEIGIEDTYVLFDSFYKDRGGSRPGDGLYVWDVQKINNNVPVATVVIATIEKFLIPDISTEAYQPDLFRFRKLYMYMENISAQQFTVSSNENNLNRFHWSPEIADSGDGSGRFLVLPLLDNEYIFTEPVRTITEMRMRFKVPFGNVPFKEDVFDAETVTSAGPSPGNRQLTTLNPHGLTPGTTVDIFIKGFNSTNDELNIFMNNPRGHIVTVIDGNVLQFTLAPTITEQLGSVLTSTGGRPKCVVYIADRRIAFTIKFRSIVTKATNFISP